MDSFFLPVHVASLPFHTPQVLNVQMNEIIFPILFFNRRNMHIPRPHFEHYLIRLMYRGGQGWVSENSHPAYNFARKK